MELKEMRKKLNMTQEEASLIFDLSRKTYMLYESDIKKVNTLKYKAMKDYFTDKLRIDEEHGILKFDEIKEKVVSVLSKYDVKSCYLFGSYAKGKATDSSDIDLIIDTSITGLDYFGLIEELREKTCKIVELLSIDQLLKNKELLSEVLKDGIKIYG